MSVLFQITLGSFLLVLCTFIHVGVMMKLTRRLRVIMQSVRFTTARSYFAVHSGVIFALMLSHTIHLYIWAFSLWALGALPGYEEPIYFALVTYTTVGYGDTTLGPAFRIFGAMASVNGILAFGMTTAFLVGLFPRFIGLPDEKDDRDGR